MRSLAVLLILLAGAALAADEPEDAPETVTVSRALMVRLLDENMQLSRKLIEKMGEVEAAEENARICKAARST